MARSRELSKIFSSDTLVSLDNEIQSNIIIQAESEQTANLLELRNSSGSVVSSIGPTGAVGGSFQGKVIQIVSATYNTAANSTSSTDAETGLSVSITPTSSSNKILVFAHQQGCRTSTNNNVLRLRLYRDSTNLLTFSVSSAETNVNQILEVGSNSCVYLDAPNTTSAITYKTQFARRAGSGTVTVQHDGSASSIVVMEVTP